MDAFVYYLACYKILTANIDSLALTDFQLINDLGTTIFELQCQFLCIPMIVRSAVSIYM